MRMKRGRFVKRNVLRIVIISVMLMLFYLVTACNISQSSNAPPTNPKHVTPTHKIINRAEVINNVRMTGLVNVIVTLSSPEIDRLTEESRSYGTIQPGEVPSEEAREADEKLAAAITAMVESVLERIHGTTYTVTRTYKTVPLIALSVDEDALLILESLSQVIRIEEDRPVPPVSFT